ncbi:MAG: heme-binding protein [Nostocaceae cyanobacterium]|nr:heme-binding protein [Nostocaceae cyanobacterium]
MPQELIDTLIQAALEEAQRQQIPITVSIVDSGGHLRALMRMEECSYFAIDMSRKKAVSSSQLKQPTHMISEIAQKIPIIQASFNTNPEIVLLAGGLPILFQGKVVGGIGISGGNFNQDRDIAEKALLAANEK